jgi:uncharacterized sulfatase
MMKFPSARIPFSPRMIPAVGVLLGILWGSSGGAFADAPRRPNIVLIFIDDMGWSDLSCFEGNRVETEHIDRLASEGIRFTNFYVNSPICSPSRVAISTGIYPQRLRITSYLANRRENERRGIDQWLDPSAPMLARQLQAAGYRTGHFGKWHMGGQRDVDDAPLIDRYGFDDSLTNFEGLGPRVLPLLNRFDGQPPKRHDLGSANLGHGPIRWEDRSEITRHFVEAATQFIDQSVELQKPFYVNLWPDDVHSPFFPPRALRESAGETKRQLYDSVLDAMDEQLGPLFDKIRNDPALSQNTIILVASDNGHEQGAGSSDPLRGSKTWLYEGGVRSPLIVWGPGHIAAVATGSTNNRSVFCALDLNRSLYTIADLPMPSDQPSDGEDLAQTLLGFEQASRSQSIFFRRPPDRPGNQQEDNPDLAVRHERWKFYVNYDGSDRQLFDLEADISETRNLVDLNPQIAGQLESSLRDWNAGLPRDAGE